MRGSSLWLGLVLAVVALDAMPQTRGDVFSGNSNDSYAARGAVLSLRHDASNGTGAPQLGLDPDYPPSLPAWLDLQRRAPAAAALYNACAQALIQATDEIKKVAPLMQGHITNLKTLNAGISKARALVKQGDTCIAKVDNSEDPRLQGGTTTQVPVPPRAVPIKPPTGGGLVPRTGRNDLPEDQPQTPVRGGTETEDKFRPQLPVDGFVVPKGFVQPRYPNKVCYDVDGFPYTVLVDPGVEPPFNSVPGFGVQEPPRIPPVRGSYDECINAAVPHGCPPRDIRRPYRPIKDTDPCRGPPDQQREPQQAETPVFHYYYVNGINTPEHDGANPGRRALNRGSYDWDRQLIGENLLGLPEAIHKTAAAKVRVAQNERNVFEDRTYNYSGAQPYLEWICREDQGWLLNSLCTPIREVNRLRGSGFAGMAGGDIRECLAQAFWRDSIDPSVDNEDVQKWVRRIVQIHRNAKADKTRRDKHYFILIGHSQGNFLVEGMAWRLLHSEGSDGREIFTSRLAILALASPSDYPSLWLRSAEGAAFAQSRMRHATRADDAILALNNADARLEVKRPFPATLPALWAYQAGALSDLLRLVADRSAQDKSSIRQYSPMLDAIGWSPDTPCNPEGRPDCNHALYTPLMNSHLIDNYLTSPTLTRPGQPLNFKVLRYLDMPKMLSVPPPVLDDVRERLRLLKAALIQG